MMSAEAKLAWALADAASACFTEADHLGIYAALGAGETYSAIVRALSVAARSQFSLPAKLIHELRTWVDGYAGNAHEPRIRNLLEAYTR
jgi:hypothetical protein